MASTTVDPPSAGTLPQVGAEAQAVVDVGLKLEYTRDVLRFDGVVTMALGRGGRRPRGVRELRGVAAHDDADVAARHDRAIARVGADDLQPGGERFDDNKPQGLRMGGVRPRVDLAASRPVTRDERSR